MALTFGQRLAHEVFNHVEARKAQQLDITRRAIEPIMAELADKLIKRPRDLLQCPICSQPPHDIRTPLFNYAHRTSAKRESPHWILVGCRHAESINFTAILNEEELDAYETAWEKHAKELFQENTKDWSPATRSQRALAIGLIEETKP